MGTRSLTRVNAENGERYLNLYRQYDGYPTGHGKELFDFLDGIEIVNGFSGDMRAGTHANGPGCLAAQIVAHYKKEIGGIYLYPTDRTDAGQDYEYIVTVTSAEAMGPDRRGSIVVEVVSYDGSLFKGGVAEFGAWCDKDDEDEGGAA